MQERDADRLGTIRIWRCFSSAGLALMGAGAASCSRTSTALAPSLAVSDAARTLLFQSFMYVF